MKTKYIVPLLMAWAAVPAFCQFEAGATVYGAFSGQPNSVSIISTCTNPCVPGPGQANAGFGVEGFLAHSVGNIQLAKFSVELPVLAVPNRGTDVSGTTFSMVAVTPDLRVNIASKARISPFLSIGGGLVHFSGNTPSATNGAFTAGGGVDFKTRIPLLTVRVQVKDLVTSWPPLLPGNGLMNNVLAGGGVIFHF